MPQNVLIQLALDFATTDEALRVAEIGVRAGVDIIEAGTPLIVSQGVGVVGELARAFPDHDVLADYKTMDSGGKNVHLTHEQGGRYMTVCANAADETVQAAITARNELDGAVKVVVDTIGVKGQPGRAAECERWGADMIFLHYAADQHRADASRDSTQWLEAVLERVSIPVGLATWSTRDSVWAAKHGAALVTIGHPLISADDPYAALREYVQRVREA